MPINASHYRCMKPRSPAEILRGTLRWFGEIAREFRHRQCASHAASLTFTTLFATVPFTAVVYLVLSALPGFDGLGAVLRGFIFENFVPESAGRIEEALVEFTEQARNLTFLGVVLLIVSIGMLLNSVEQAFNHVWGVNEPRRGLVRLIGYWGIVTLGPLMVGLGFLASSYVATLPILSEAGIAPARAQLVPYIPEAFSFLAFSLLFHAVPNCRVRVHHALAGGLLATVLLEVAKTLFTTIMTLSNLNVIYGAFAALPLFLVWVYLVWSIILGVALAVANFGGGESRTGRTPMLLKVLWMIELVARVHPKGYAPRELARQADLTRIEWNEAMDVLGKLDVITLSEGFVLLGHSAQFLPLGQLYERFPAGVTLASLAEYPGQPGIVEPLARFLATGERMLASPLALKES